MSPQIDIEPFSDNFASKTNKTWHVSVARTLWIHYLYYINIFQLATVLYLPVPSLNSHCISHLSSISVNIAFKDLGHRNCHCFCYIFISSHPPHFTTELPWNVCKWVRIRWQCGIHGRSTTCAIDEKGEEFRCLGKPALFWATNLETHPNQDSIYVWI